MSSFLTIALQCAARGWHVFPLKPRGKYPVIPRTAGGTGYKDATVDAAQIAAWWAQYPNANVGIACGASDLYVVDCDHGLKSEEDFRAWHARNNLPATYTVRTGRRTAMQCRCISKAQWDTTAGGIWTVAAVKSAARAALLWPWATSTGHRGSVSALSGCAVSPKARSILTGEAAGSIRW